MVSRFAAPDSVALTGGVVGLASLAVDWLTLRPNRIASGTGLKLWESFGWGPAAVLLALWLVCLALSIGGRRRNHVILLGVSLNLLVILTLLFSGVAASRLLEDQSSLARVSASAGVWVSLLGAYIAIFSCRQRLGGDFFWQSLVSWAGLAAFVILLLTGWLNNLSVLVEFRRQQAQFFLQLWNHIVLSGGSVVIGTLIGVPLGIWASRSRLAERPVFWVTNVLQTVPSLVLFGLLIAPLSALSMAYPVLRQWGITGIGTAPAMIALVIYSLLPVARNTYVGLKQLDPAVIDAGRGMGMSRWQVFRRLEVSLSAPLALEGVLTASVQAVANTAVAALIGAGGLGVLIFQGISQAANDVVILGALPIMALALVVDTVMRGVVKIATPKGVAG